MGEKKKIVNGSATEHSTRVQNFRVYLSKTAWIVNSERNLGDKLQPACTPIFTLIGNNDFWSCHTDFGPKMSPKIGKFESSWISRRDRVGFSNCLDLQKDFGPKMSPNLESLSFLGYLGEMSWTLKTVLDLHTLLCHGQCFQLSCTFHVLTCSGGRDSTLMKNLYPSFGWPSS